MKKTLPYSLWVLFLLLCLNPGAVFAQQVGPVDLTFWARNQATADLLQTLFDDWAAENAPGSTLRVHTYGSQLNSEVLTAGQLPDALIDIGELLPLYASAGLLLPLEQYFDLGVYDRALVTAGQVQGVSYGLPLFSGGHLMLIFDNTLVSAPPRTFDELLALVAQIEAEHSDVFGLVFPVNEPHYLMPFAFGFGGSIFDNQGNFTLDTPSWVEALRFMRTLADIVPENCDAVCTDELFLGGSAAMVIAPDTSLNTYLSDDQTYSFVGIAPWPVLPSGQRPRSYISAEYASIPVTTDGDKLAVVTGFFNWMTTQSDVAVPVALGFGVLPSVTALQNDSRIADDPLMSISLEVYRDGLGAPSSTRMGCLWQALQDPLNAVLSDSLSPQDAAAQAQLQASDCAARLG
ncbi:MAG: extracellular solute-binding protein [Chloroflexi bacterium]|nr:extracellular solute-binding protein [Chloroflexota bacterium]